jgi:hypothetical protein
LNEQHCRFPARHAALKAAQVLCSHKPPYADVVCPEDGLAYLSHEWWFSATGRAMQGSTPNLFRTPFTSVVEYALLGGHRSYSDVRNRIDVPSDTQI